MSNWLQGFQELELYEAKVSRTVLRGGFGSNAESLPDNELRSRSIRECGVFLLAFDIHPYTKGASKELGLHSEILKYIASECATRR